MRNNICIHNIEDLEYLKKSGLMKICSRNWYFHGYWDMDVIEIKKKIASCIEDGLEINVPLLKETDFKEKYKNLILPYL